VIGGAAGAFPPLIGEAAVSGTVGIETIVLFLIIFLWTPSHFWALALTKSDDYARAGIPMMPNVAGPDSTRRQIFAYTLLLVPAGLAPVALGFAGLAYAVISTLSGAAMLALAAQVLVHRNGAPRNTCSPSRSFTCSCSSLLCSQSTVSASFSRSYRRSLRQVSVALHSHTDAEDVSRRFHIARTQCGHCSYSR
jgi:protoheme IX farnesyltransferase